MLEPCVWCDAPSKFRCGACRETTFCSAACQKTTWPIHKHLCGAPNGAFRQAPLDEREAAAMDTLKDELHGHPPNAWIWQRQLDRYTAGVPEFREWKNVRAAMTAPAAKPPFLMPDGAREYAIAFARAHLNFHDHYTQYYDKRKLWHTIEAALLTCVETKINSHGHGQCRCTHGENYQLDVHAEMAVAMAGYLRETAYIQLGLCLLMDEDEEATVEQKREWNRIVRRHYIFINYEIREAPVESNMKWVVKSKVLLRHCEFDELVQGGEFGDLS